MKSKFLKCFSFIAALMLVVPFSQVFAAKRIAYCNATKYSKSRAHGFNQAQQSTCKLSLANVGTVAQEYCVVYSSSTETLTYSDGTSRGAGTPTKSGSDAGSDCTAAVPTWVSLAAGASATITLTYSTAATADFPVNKKNARQKVFCKFDVYVQDTDTNAGTVAVSGVVTTFLESSQLYSSASGSGSYKGVALVNSEQLECSQRVF